MNEQERRIVEVGYNLSQAYLKAKRNNQYKTCQSIICAIYGFNGIAYVIAPNFRNGAIGKELFKIGQLWHDRLLHGGISSVTGIGEGLSFENEDFLIDDVLKENR